MTSFSSFHSHTTARPTVSPTGVPVLGEVSAKLQPQALERGEEPCSPCSQTRAKQPQHPLLFLYFLLFSYTDGMFSLCSSPSVDLPEKKTTDINPRSDSERGGKSAVNPNKNETIWQKEKPVKSPLCPSDSSSTTYQWHFNRNKFHLRCCTQCSI